NFTILNSLTTLKNECENKKKNTVAPNDSYGKKFFVESIKNKIQNATAEFQLPMKTTSHGEDVELALQQRELTATLFSRALLPFSVHMTSPFRTHRNVTH
ncbi:conserved hypothetical protein, partial [Trichinella spiralis]|uniref:hypothetical protein n=1 Tax=Trichinella spiralis TaxID=6334 RepID=UPI0001EFD4B1